MTFINGLEMGKLSLINVNKAKARENLEQIKDDILAGNITDRTGRLFAETMTFFDPPINKKSDLGFVCAALGNKSDKRWYARHAVVLPGIGLCATDSRRLHIIKDFENDKPIYNPVTKTWLTEKEADRDLSIDYPSLDKILENKPNSEIEKDDLKNDDENITITKDDIVCRFPKKCIYDVIGTFKNPKFYWKSGREPLWIEDDTKLSIIMPLY